MPRLSPSAAPGTPGVCSGRCRAKRHRQTEARELAEALAGLIRRLGFRVTVEAP